MQRADNTFARLDDLLAAERRHLLAGKITDLTPLIREIEQAVDNLPSSGVTPDRLRAIRTQAGRNANLLRAARCGLQDALDRHNCLQQGPTQFRTYDAQGHRQPPAAALSRNLERRA